jgi:hypothetical protein
MKNKIAKLNQMFPKIKAVSTVEWDGEEGGIWFRQEGEYHTDDMLYFDYWSSNEQVHPEVQKALKSLGLYAEPYDAGTWMAYEA